MEIIALDSAEAAEHLPALVELLRDAVDGGASVGYLPPLDPAEAEAYWRGVLAALDTAHRILLVAVEDGQLVGTVQLALESRPNGSHRAEVSKLLVHSAHRRRGIGQALMRTLEDTARIAGRTTLVLDTLQGDAGEQLYRRLGYLIAGVIPQYARVGDGSLQPTVLYYKLLETSQVL